MNTIIIIKDSIKFRRYPAYNNSDVEWLGEIPAHWEIEPTKKYFSFEKGRNAQLLTHEYINTHMGDFPVYSGQTSNNGVMGTINSYQYERRKALLSTTVGSDLVMTLRLVSGKFSLSQNCLIMIPKNRAIDINFYYYALMPTFQYERGSIPSYMQSSLRISDMSNFRVATPPINDQIEIAAFLDHETARIDALVAKKERLIELLQEKRAALIAHAVTKGLDPHVLMKDSGVEWLGEIPANWEVKSLKRFSNLQSGTAITSEEIEEEGEFPVFGGNGIRGYASSYTNNGEFALIGRQGALCGCVSYSSGKFWASEHAIVVTPYSKAISRWMFYLLNAMSLNTYSQSAAQPGLAVETIKALSAPLPPIIEQRDIVEFLEYETTRIDSLVSRVHEAIELLMEYRTALISAAVTGKIDVREEIE